MIRWPVISGTERHRGRETVVRRSWHADGPVLGHGQFFAVSVRKFQGYKRLLDGVVAVGYNIRYDALDFRGNHAFMGDGVGFRHFGDDVAAVEILPFFHCDMGRPFLLTVQGIYADAPGDESAGARCRRRCY